MSNSPEHVELVRRLIGQLGGALPFGARTGEIPVSHYVSPERFALEQERVFARAPVIALHESELRENGAVFALDVGGIPIFVARGLDGKIRGFRNSCRHRGTALVDAPCTKKALVCRYHGWTYDLSGARTHAPHLEVFQGEDHARTTLAPAYAEARHGFVWVGLTPFDVKTHLGALDLELAALGAGSATLYQRVTRDVPGNWKLIVDAFLDGYHIKHLHQHTVNRFFIDAKSEAIPVGDHIRAMTARRTLLDFAGKRDHAFDGENVRDLGTPSYFVFPNTILILHPDYTSVLTMTPLAADRTRFSHSMLIAAPPKSDAEDAHWKKSFALIDEGVFVAEDLAVVAAMQRGFLSRANETILFGALEHAALWFHEALARQIA